MKFLPGCHSIPISGTTVGHPVQRFRLFTKVFDLERIVEPKIDPRFLVVTEPPIASGHLVSLVGDVERDAGTSGSLH